MKHAILILGYRNFEFVKSQIEKLDDDFYVIIHWDSRYSLTLDQKEWIESNPRITFGQPFECNWGSFGIVRAELWLCEEGLKTDADYFHLISDMDMVINIKSFKLFFNENINSYITFYEFENPQNLLGLYHRLEKYNYKIPEEYKLYKEDIKNQIKENKYRSFDFNTIYGSSQWWSLRRDKIKYLISLKDVIYKNFIDTKFSDEYFVQTVLLNKDNKNIINENLRYINWSIKNGNIPAILDCDDYNNIINSKDVFFIRKIDPVISKELIDKLNNYYK